MLKSFFSFLIVMVVVSAAHAESGKKGTLDWPNPTEKLVYYSCGCADSCWVADLQDKAKGTSKIELRCGCETMHLKIKGVEKPYDAQCATFQNDDKFERIVAEIAKIQADNKPKQKSKK